MTEYNVFINFRVLNQMSEFNGKIYRFQEVRWEEEYDMMNCYY